MKYLKVTLISIGTVVLGIGLLSAIAFWAAKTFYLTPEKLTSLIKQEVNERTNIVFDCQSIELSYWDTWPTLSIAVKDGKRLSDAILQSPTPLHKLRANPQK